MLQKLKSGPDVSKPIEKRMIEWERSSEIVADESGSMDEKEHVDMNFLNFFGSLGCCKSRYYIFSMALPICVLSAADSFAGTSILDCNEVVSFSVKVDLDNQKVLDVIDHKQPPYMLCCRIDHSSVAGYFSGAVIHVSWTSTVEYLRDQYADIQMNVEIDRTLGLAEVNRTFIRKGEGGGSPESYSQTAKCRKRDVQGF